MSSTFGCPHCGHSNAVEAAFCGGCGTNLQEIDAALLPADDLFPVKKKGAESGESTPPPADPAPPAEPTALTEPTAPEAPPADPAVPKASPPPPAPDAPDRAKPAPDADRVPLPMLLSRFQQEWRGAVPPLPEEALQDLAKRAVQQPPSPERMDDEERRRLRNLINEDIPLLDLPQRPANTQSAAQGGELPRQPWIGWLVVVSLLAVLLLGDAPATVTVHAWPGVEEAHTAINQLSPESVALINWAYDPATAGEMDLVALPVMEHLIRSQSRLVVISQLPGGPATARRLMARAGQQISPQERAAFFDSNLVEGGFLPGGASVLALLGQDPATGLPVDAQGSQTDGRLAITRLEQAPPALTLVFAAQAEGVQRWLEQVQPLNRTPVIAVVSGAADPALRPYLESGQLAGLVSGYSGGLAYEQRNARNLSRAEERLHQQRSAARNWLLWLVILLALLGNLAAHSTERGWGGWRP